MLPVGHAEVSSSTPINLMGGLMGDEHRLRKAQIRHRELDLEGRRVDARISSLESLATQATLLAGFTYSALSPTSDDTGMLSPSFLFTPTGIVCAFATVTSFCSALWVVYLTGYASIRARVTFLQGTRSRAVEATIDVLVETQNYARFYFDLSMGSLVLGAMAVVWRQASWYTLPLLSVFVAFVLNGAICECLPCLQEPSPRWGLSARGIRSSACPSHACHLLSARTCCSLHMVVHYPYPSSYTCCPRSPPLPSALARTDKRKIDLRLGKWTHEDDTRDPFGAECGGRLDEIEEGIKHAFVAVGPYVSAARMRAARGVKWVRTSVPCVRGLPRCVEQCIGGKEAAHGFYETFDEGAGAVSRAEDNGNTALDRLKALPRAVASALTGQPQSVDSTTAASDGDDEEAAARPAVTKKRVRISVANLSPQSESESSPPTGRPTRGSAAPYGRATRRESDGNLPLQPLQSLYPLAYRGWAYKTRSFGGKCHDHLSKPTQKRFFEYNHNVRVLSSCPTIVLRLIPHVLIADAAWPHCAGHDGGGDGTSLAYLLLRGARGPLSCQAP